MKKLDKPRVNGAETEKQEPKTETEQIVLANWGRRGVAWFIDYVIVNIMLAYFQIEHMETSLLPPQFCQPYRESTCHYGRHYPL